jgi:hypothetical protein
MGFKNLIMARADVLPTTFLPDFTQNGRIYAFSSFLALDTIRLTISGLVGCADLAR